MGLVPRVASIAVVFACGCGDAGAFACQGDAQCAAAGGICQPQGWCSFPADACPSGQRFGEHAGGGLAGTCVPEDDASTAAGSGGDISGPAATGPSLPTGDVGDSTSTMPVVDDSTGPPLPGTTTTDTDDAASSTSSDSTGAAIDPSLVAWYTFDDPTDLFADASGNELHGYCGQADCPLWQAGILDGAIRIDGVDDHVHVEHDPLLELTDEMTVAVWVSVDSAMASFNSIFCKPIGPSESNSWEIGIEGTGEIYFGGGDLMDQSGVTAPAIELRTWHHLAMTLAGDELRAFIDGELVGTAMVIPFAYDNHTLYIGADADFEMDDNFFHGAVDDARIYDRQLDDAEIAALAASGEPP